MFGRLFGRKQAAAAPAPVEDPALAGLLAYIQENKADPEIAAKVAGHQIDAWLMQCVETEQGVHIESLLVALGALGGLACQYSARFALKAGALPALDTPWAEAKGADGHTYHLGDAINHCLLEGPYNLWALTAGFVQHKTGRPVPDVGEIAAHVAATIGGPDFGLIRYPEGTSAAERPIDYVQRLWPTARQRLELLGVHPGQWPLAFGFAGQEALSDALSIIDPEAALMMFIESAVAMAKIDPGEYGLDAPALSSS
jgi:hypothetical protein